jgi:hypothetical protein
MSVAEILEAIRRLPAAERRGLVEHIWQAWPVSEGVFPWNPPKAEIATLLDRAKELERTEHLLKNSREPEPAPAPEPAAAPEATLQKAADPKPFAKVLTEITERPVSPQELADEAAILGRRLREHLNNPADAGSA